MSPMPCPPGAAGASAATVKRCCRAKKRPSGISATKAFGDTALHKKKPRSCESGACFCRRRLPGRQLLVHVPHAVPAGSGRSICGNSEALLPREETTLRDLRHQGLGDTALHKKKPRSRERGLLLPKASVSTATPSTCPPCRARRERPELSSPPGSPLPGPRW